MEQVPFDSKFGEEHQDVKADRKIYSDGAVIARIACMLEDDLPGTIALILRAICGYTYEAIGMQFRPDRCPKCGSGLPGLTRQALEQRIEKLADKYPSLAGVLVDKTLRDKIGDDDGRKKRIHPR